MLKTGRQNGRKMDGNYRKFQKEDEMDGALETDVYVELIDYDNSMHPGEQSFGRQKWRQGDISAGVHKGQSHYEGNKDWNYEWTHEQKQLQNRIDALVTAPYIRKYGANSAIITTSA